MGQIMNTFKITSSYPQGVTILPNAFLDGYMPEANGEFVKIYLYLLHQNRLLVLNLILEFSFFVFFLIIFLQIQSNLA